MNTRIDNRISQLIEEQDLPASYRLLVEQYIAPLAEQVNSQASKQSRPLVVGINGAQGSGKSTLCLFLQLLLEQLHGRNCVILSIDDFYYSKTQRQQFASNIHPLLITRGVPGTHNVALAIETIEKLLEGSAVSLPGFDKANDDTLSEELWTLQNSKVDIILFEGWCVGSCAQDEDALEQPINTLEQLEDPNGNWRRYVNHQLLNNYQNLIFFH